MKKTQTIDSRILTANELTDVKDIKNGFLYTKSGFVIGFLRLFPVNIDLLSDSEKESKSITLTSTFKSEKKPFIIYSIPRTVDMEAYLSNLSDLYDSEINNLSRKTLLKEMIKEASEKVMSGHNYEHQFYIKVWEKYSSADMESERILSERLKEFESRYQAVGNMTKRLDDTEIIKLCNLFGNSNTAIFDTYENVNYVPIPQMRK